MKKTLLISLFLSILFQPISYLADDPIWIKKEMNYLKEKKILSNKLKDNFNGNKKVNRYFFCDILSPVIDKIDNNKTPVSLNEINKTIKNYNKEYNKINKKYSKISSSLLKIKKDIFNTKINVIKNIKKEEQPKLKYSGIISIRHFINTYGNSSDSALPKGNPNTLTGNGAYLDHSNENANHFSTLSKFEITKETDNNFIDILLVTPDIGDIWGNKNDNKAPVIAQKLVAYFRILPPFFKNISVGRQYYTIGNGLILDGNEDELKNGYAIDSIITRSDIMGFNIESAYIKSTLESGQGFNASCLSATMNLNNYKLGGYFASRNDDNFFDPYSPTTYKDSNNELYPGLGAFIVNKDAENNKPSYDTVHDAKWFGLTLGTNLYGFKINADAAMLIYKQNIPDIYKNSDFSENISNQYGLLINSSGKIKNISLKLNYRYHSPYFRPFLHTSFSNGGTVSRNIPGYEDFSNLGYSSNFSDIYLFLSKDIFKRSKAFFSTELINEKKSFMNRKKDNMKVYSGGFDYKYKAHSKFRLWAKHFDVVDISKGDKLTSLAVDNNGNEVYDIGDDLNLHDTAWEDHTLCSIELIFNF